MRCPKCEGLVVEETVQTALYEMLYVDRLNMWRCVNCGLLYDRLLLNNQAEQKQRKQNDTTKN